MKLLSFVFDHEASNKVVLVVESVSSWVVICLLSPMPITKAIATQDKVTAARI
jgi:hypothetical protein